MSETHLQQLMARHGERYKWFATCTAMVGAMAMSLSSTIVNVALPGIMQTFAVSHSEVQWLATAFMAAMTVGMLVNAWCVNTFGLRRTYLGAMAIFLLACALGGLAPSFAVLVASRVAQGLMAGLIQPLALLIIYQVFPVNERGKAMGIYGMGVILGPTFGPVLGGVMMDLVSWRWVFLVVVPVVFGGLYMAMTFLARPDIALTRRRLDVPGLVLLALWLTALLWTLSNAALRGWADPWLLGGIATTLIALGIFVWVQLRRREPLMAMAVFLQPGFAGAFLLAALTGAGLFGSIYLLPLLVQTELGFSATEAGLLLVPAGLVMAVVFPIVGRMADVYGTLWLVGSGLLVFAASSLLLGFAADGSTFLRLACWAALGRIGMALLMPPVVVGSLRLLPEPLINQGAGVISFARQFGGAIGVSLAAMVLQSHAGISPAGESASSLAQGYRQAFFLLAALYLLGLLPLWWMVQGERRLP